MLAIHNLTSASEQDKRDVYDILQWILFFSKSQRALLYLFAKVMIYERNTKLFCSFPSLRVSE